jgi:hypothetical protein
MVCLFRVAVYRLVSRLSGRQWLLPKSLRSPIRRVQAEEVVVSATKTPVPVTQVTSAVEVITAQDMKKQNIRSVVDALRLAQGVAVFSSGGPGTEVTAKNSRRRCESDPGTDRRRHRQQRHRRQLQLCQPDDRQYRASGDSPRRAEYVVGVRRHGRRHQHRDEEGAGAALRHRLHGIRVLRLPA